MVEDDRPLAIISWPPGKRTRIFFDLFDQALLVRGNNVHRPLLAREQLKSRYPQKAMGALDGRRIQMKEAAPPGDRLFQSIFQPEA